MAEMEINRWAPFPRHMIDATPTTTSGTSEIFVEVVHASSRRRCISAASPLSALPPTRSRHLPFSRAVRRPPQPPPVPFLPALRCRRRTSRLIAIGTAQAKNDRATA